MATRSQAAQSRDGSGRGRRRRETTSPATRAPASSATDAPPEAKAQTRQPGKTRGKKSPQAPSRGQDAPARGGAKAKATGKPAARFTAPPGPAEEPMTLLAATMPGTSPQDHQPGGQLTGADAVPTTGLEEAAAAPQGPGPTAGSTAPGDNGTIVATAPGVAPHAPHPGEPGRGEGEGERPQEAPSTTSPHTIRIEDMTTTASINSTAPAAPAARGKCQIKPKNALLLGLLALTLVSGFRGSRTAHLAAGLLLTTGLGVHCWNRRKAL